MNYMPYVKKMCPQMVNSPMMEQPVESLESMYPQIYNVVYPQITQMCGVMDVQSNPEMYPYPSKAMIERMTDDIYARVVIEIGDTGEDDSREEDDRQISPYYGGIPAYGYGFAPGYGYSPGYGYGGFGFGRRRFLRDLIGILLIRELLRRRGIFY